MDQSVQQNNRLSGKQIKILKNRSIFGRGFFWKMDTLISSIWKNGSHLGRMNQDLEKIISIVRKQISLLTIMKKEIKEIKSYTKRSDY